MIESNNRDQRPEVIASDEVARGHLPTDKFVQSNNFGLRLNQEC